MIRDWQPTALTRHERRVVRSLVEAIYDPCGTGKTDAALEPLLRELEAWLASPDLATRSALRVALLLIELSPVRFGFGLRTMGALSRDERVCYVGALDANGVVALDMWKTLLGTAYFGHPVGAAELGCAEPVEERRPFRLRVAS
jgi:hypothetical protein